MSRILGAVHFENYGQEKNKTGVGIMAVYETEKYNDSLTFTSDQISNLHQKIDELTHDLIKILHAFFEKFSQVISMLDWDYMAVEFWLDCGQLYLFPEKIVDKTISFSDLGATERLDPYLTICLISYLKKYDAYVENYYISDDEFEAWYLENVKEIVNSLDIALSDYRLSSFILKSLNNEKIVFRYFGCSRETEYGETTISTIKK